MNGERGYTVDSALGGQDYYDSNGKRAYSINGLFGGKDIHGDISGFSVDHPLGGEDLFLDEDADGP